MIRIGICGYGNLGRGVERAVRMNSDMELAGVFSRRDPETIRTVYDETQVYSVDVLPEMKDSIDVLILCGGSATDLGVQSPQYAADFNIVDSFDNHSVIPEHIAAVGAAAEAGGHMAVVSAGWDPGLFSVNRLYAESVLPEGSTYTFWGRGVSQGHSDAVRRIEGVADAIQYTIPVEEALERVREGCREEMTARQQHRRQCFVVAEEGADLDRIRHDIVTMPAYFEPYDTEVNFITMEEMDRDHRNMPHGGSVIRSGVTGEGTSQVYEFSLKLGSNPEFTSSVLVAYARACFRMAAAGETGARSVFEIAPYLLSPRSLEELHEHTL